MLTPTDHPRTPTMLGHRRSQALRLLALMAMILLHTRCSDDTPTPPDTTASDTRSTADAQARYAQAAQHEDALTLTITPAAHPAPRPDKPLPKDTSCVTSECHANLVTAAYVHGPVGVGTCDACHDRDAGGHTYPLKREPQATCQFCHPVSNNKPFQHQPMIESDCTTCHDPHMSKAKYLLVSDNVQQLCTQCHEMPTGRYQHAPYALGECTLCHTPHESDNRALLRGQDGPTHCFTCHDDKQTLLTSANYTHEPARDGCVTCHNPHASPFPQQLTQPMTESCLSCHEPMRQHMANAAFPHGAVDDDRSCANCHDAHATDRSHLVHAREDQLCLTCHDEPIRNPAGRWIRSVSEELSRPHLHGPIRHGDCAACHDPHGETQANLLKGNVPNTFYASFDAQRYELCFSCHTKDMVMTERSTNLTDFRQGDLNLHFVHVNRDEKGRTCRTCHEIHGSDRPGHIAKSVPFEGSGWAMPIAFEQTPTGGTCSPGCHEPSTYDRNITPTEVAAKDPAS